MLRIETTALFMGLLVAIAGSSGSAQSQSPLIRVAGPPVDSAGEMFYAADMGFFKNAGLNVEVTALNSTGTLAAGVVSGALEIGSLTVPTIAVARDRGIPLVVVAPAGIYDSRFPTSGLIVPKGSSIRTAADLSGKTVATRELTNLSYYGAKIWIDRNGGDSSTVHFVEMPDSEASAALRSGRVDAASVTSPDLGQALAGDDRLLAPIYDAIGSTFLVGVYFTSESYAKDHPEIVRKFYDVITETARWANKNRDQSSAILAKYRHAALPRGPRVTYTDQLLAADVQPLLDLLYKYGALKNPQKASSMFAPGIPSK